MSSTPSHPTPSSSLVLDPQALQRLHEGGGPELIVELIDLFLDDGPALVGKLQAADHDDALGRAAHALKGSCLSLGLSELAELCRRIEQTVEAGGDARADLPKLDAVYARATQALRDARGRF